MISPAPKASASPAPAVEPPPPDKPLLQAWLLLFLAAGESYGWALLRALRDRGIVVDPSLVYRDLRKLESAGTVTSRWTESVSGPRRRSYRITRKGRRMLAELAADVEAVWEQHESFARILERARADEAATPGAPALPALPVPAQQVSAGERAATRPGRELVAAWLLLLLEHETSYGYELRQELEVYGVGIDTATLYRRLRRLERAGYLESRWMSPSAGPRRRVYHVTVRGRRHLDELVGLLTRIRDTHGAFLSAYESQASGRARGARALRLRKDSDDSGG